MVYSVDSVMWRGCLRGAGNQLLLKAAPVASLILRTEMCALSSANGMKITVVFWDALRGYVPARMARRGSPCSSSLSPLFPSRYLIHIILHRFSSLFQQNRFHRRLSLRHLHSSEIHHRCSCSESHSSTLAVSFQRDQDDVDE